MVQQGECHKLLHAMQQNILKCLDIACTVCTALSVEQIDQAKLGSLCSEFAETIQDTQQKLLKVVNSYSPPTNRQSAPYLQLLQVQANTDKLAALNSLLSKLDQPLDQPMGLQDMRDIVPPIAHVSTTS